jgi:uridine kinase
MSFVIILAGGTASGKTTIANVLAERLEALVLTHDRYYKDIEIQEGHNFDEPAALDNERIVQDIKQLKEDLPTEVPVYHFPTHKRLAYGEHLIPKPFLLVEGILTLSVPEIARQGDLTIFVDVEDDIRLARRIQRDVLERGRSIKSVLTQYLSTVRPMHHLYIKPVRSTAHLVLDGTAPLEENIDRILESITKISL